MSVQAVTWALAQDIAKPGAKLTLVALANYCDAEGFSVVGQKLLQAHTSLGETTVRGHLKWLEENGYLLRERRHQARRGWRSTDQYYLPVPDLAKLTAPLSRKEAKKRLPAKTEGRVPTGRNWGGLPAETEGHRTCTLDYVPSQDIELDSDSGESGSSGGGAS